jgi:streptogramin lyase
MIICVNKSPYIPLIIFFLINCGSRGKSSAVRDIEDISVEVIISKDVKTWDESSESENPECEDKDGDGFGKGCLKGADCDDTNPYFHINCPHCDTEHAPGCPCKKDSDVKVCYTGEKSKIGKGECKAGTMICIGKKWSGCHGETVESEEVCDYKDNNCDGETDEGLLSPCGDCDVTCDVINVGPENSEDPFNPDENNSYHVTKTSEGFITLTEKTLNSHFIWIANSPENTVSELDTKTGFEIARFNICANPSRTSVDLDGSVWVGCRNDGHVVKIAHNKKLCVDKDGDKIIETSEDKNGDHKITPDEMLPYGQDECLIVDVKPDPQNNNIRAAAVDKENYAWVGGWDTIKIYRLHPEDGFVVDSTGLAQYGVGQGIYGMAIDKNGVIWLSMREFNKLVSVNPQTKEVKIIPNNPKLTFYGIAVDKNGKVWIGNGETSNIVRYNPSDGTWKTVQPLGDYGYIRGVAISNSGFLYAAHNTFSCIKEQTSRYVTRVNVNTEIADKAIDLGGFKGAVGMAIDTDENVWSVNMCSNSATKMDQDGKIIGEYPVGKSPYTYSDMTGYALFNVVASDGYYQHVVGGFESKRTVWEFLWIFADTPSPSYIKVRVKSADDTASLENKQWSPYYGPYPPEVFPLDLQTVPDLEGNLLAIEISLYSPDNEHKPVVKGIKVQVDKKPQ